jgi:hypothetical protein
MKQPRGWKVKQVVLFALAGPPLGALLWQIFVAVTAEFPRHYSLGSWLSIWAGLSVFAYLWGFAPAFLTGVVAVYMRDIAPGVGAPSRLLRLAATVGSGGLLCWALPQVFPGGDTGVIEAALGAATAFVCASWAEWWVRPNNSFKPTPLRGAA